MAIYHFSAQVISRSSGGNAVAAAAYRAGEKIQEHDYCQKGGVDYTEILTPENAPEWAKNRESLWNTVEAVERRRDAQLCREINIALPLELKPEERQKLAYDFCRNFTQLGMVADLAIHGQNTGNPHAHIMLTMRELTPEGFGPKKRDWNRRELVEEWREEWAKAANLALERAGYEARIDHRTLAAQGIDREPTIHQGKAVTALERKGEKTYIGTLNALLKQQKQDEQEIAFCREELQKIEKEAQAVAAKQELNSSQILEGEEWLKIAQQYRQEVENTFKQLSRAQQEHEEASKACKEAQSALEAHSREAMQAGLVKRLLKGSKMQLREMELEENLRACGVKYAEKRRVVDELSEKIAEYRIREREAQKAYEQSPHGQFAARFAENRELLERQYGNAIAKLVYPDAPKYAARKFEYKQYLDKMAKASPSELGKMKEELRRAEKRYEVQELFYKVAEHEMPGSSINDRKQMRDALLAQWEQAMPEAQNNIEKNAKGLIKMPKKQLGMSL